MKKISTKAGIYFLAAALVFGAPFFTACSTGTGDGETNVEDASGKDVHEKSGHDKDADGVEDNERGADR